MFEMSNALVYRLFKKVESLLDSVKASQWADVIYKVEYSSTSVEILHGGNKELTTDASDDLRVTEFRKPVL